MRRSVQPLPRSNSSPLCASLCLALSEDVGTLTDQPLTWPLEAVQMLLDLMPDEGAARTLVASLVCQQETGGTPSTFFQRLVNGLHSSDEPAACASTRWVKGRNSPDRSRQDSGFNCRQPHPMQCFPLMHMQHPGCGDAPAEYRDHIPAAGAWAASDALSVPGAGVSWQQRHAEDGSRDPHAAAAQAHAGGGGCRCALQPACQGVRRNAA